MGIVLQLTRISPFHDIAFTSLGLQPMNRSQE